MEFNLEKVPTISTLFMKGLIRDQKSYKGLIEQIKFYADYHSFDFEYTRYIFLLTCLKNHEFFNIEEDIRENLLYDSTFWASLNETKRKTRPANHEDFSDEKKDAFFTKLQKEVIKSIYHSFDHTLPTFDIILNKYILFFFDLSCIKRDRRNGKDCK